MAGQPSLMTASQKESSIARLFWWRGPLLGGKHAAGDEDVAQLQVRVHSDLV